MRMEEPKAPSIEVEAIQKSPEDRMDDLLEKLIHLLAGNNEKEEDRLRLFWETKVANLTTEDAIQELEKAITTRGSLDRKKGKALALIKEIESNGGREKYLLGTGSVATVYTTPYSEDVGIKVLTNEAQRVRHGNTFYQEGDYMTELKDFEVDGIRSPHLYYNDKNDDAYIGMEIIQGKSLRDLRALVIKGDKSVQGIARHILSQDKEEVIRRFTNYLTRMHSEKKIVHRDVDDGNIMIDQDGNWYLIDFGMAKWIEIGEDESKLEQEDLREMRFTVREIYSVLESQKID